MTKTNVKSSVFNLALIGIFIALILMLTFSGIGYIPLGFGFTVTIVPIVVAIGAVISGPVGGSVLGLAFGITSYSTCFLGMDAMGVILLDIAPIKTAIVCIVPRILIGLLTGLIFKGLQKIDKTKIISYAVACLSCPLLNTLLFLGSLWLFFSGEFTTNADLISLLGTTIANPVTLFMLFAGVNGIVEAIATTIIGTPIAKVLNKVKENTIK